MIIGIDLGTTNSLVAYWDSGEVKIIPNIFDEYLTPSVISVDNNEEILIGKPALYRMAHSPERSVANFKRFMGSNKIFQLGKHKFRAEDLSAIILKQLKEDAENFLQDEITEAVISVPAYFSDAQRKATKIAGQLSGLKVERLINEPTAAGLAYGFQEQANDTNYLIFDLGGGTFDVSILTQFMGIIEVRASSGENLLGGLDFTNLIKNAFERDIILKTKKKSLPLTLIEKLYEQAEIAKHKLSLESDVTLKTQCDNQSFEFNFSRKVFDEEAKPLLTKIQYVVQRVINDAQLAPSQINQVVLVGGATRMPIIKTLVGKMFGKFPLTHLNPDLVIAKGVAIQAGLKANDQALDEIVITDVSPYSLGIAVSTISKEYANELVFDPIIERNTVIPASRSCVYRPCHPKQKKILIKIYQGENYFVEKNIFLGKLLLELDENLQDPAVEVRFTYDINGLLEVEATVLEINKKKTLVIEGNPGVLTEEEIKTRLLELSKIKIHPREQSENILLLKKAERLYIDLQGDQRKRLGFAIEKFIEILNQQDPVAISHFNKQLAQILEELENNLKMV